MPRLTIGCSQPSYRKTKTKGPKNKKQKEEKKKLQKTNTSSLSQCVGNTLYIWLLWRLTNLVRETQKICEVENMEENMRDETLLLSRFRLFHLCGRWGGEGRGM